MNLSTLSRIVFVCAIFAGLAACSTPSEKTSLDGGAQGYRITCGGPLSSVSDCYERAGYVCGNKGYTVVRELDIKPPSSSDYFWNPAAHETLVRCNAP